MLEDKLTMSADYRLLLLAKTESPCSAVSAIAKLLVEPEMKDDRKRDYQVDKAQQTSMRR